MPLKQTTVAKLFLIISIIFFTPKFGHGSQLSKIINEAFIKKVEKKINCKIEVKYGSTNDYTDCGEAGYDQYCTYWFMKEGDYSAYDKAMLTFEIEKSNLATGTIRTFMDEMDTIIAWRSNDEGTEFLDEEGKKIKINGFSQCRLFNSYYRKTVIAMIDTYFIKIEYDVDIHDNKVYQILKNIRKALAD